MYLEHCHPKLNHDIPVAIAIAITALVHINYWKLEVYERI